MAAGGFKEFQAGEVLDQDDINDYLLQGVLVFAGTAARGSAITSPVEGQFSFLKDSDKVEFWDGSAWVELSVDPIAFEYLVVGGGGGGAGFGSTGSFAAGGGGGGGGYRTNVSGQTSGDGATAEIAYALTPGTYPITVGAGGAGGASETSGNQSVLGNIYSLGGGAGGNPSGRALGGGCGGGGGSSNGPFGNGTVRSGKDGGRGSTGGNPWAGGGGGGASAVGLTTDSNTGGAGGAGQASTITGSSVTRAGGGGGGGTSGGAGGAGGGGAGGGTGTAGTVNTGGGGGGGGNSGSGARDGGAGGSGVVIFRVPAGTSISFSGGVTQTSSTSGGQDIYVVTATSTTSETFTIG